MLALPAPTANGNGLGSKNQVTMDPFAASLEVAPPPYVQMNDMERKQRLLMEEQMIWDQYSRNGRQGYMFKPNNQQQQQHYQFQHSMGPYSYTPRY